MCRVKGPVKRKNNLRLAALRLAGLIEDRQVILFKGNSADKGCPHIKLSIWRVIPTNELLTKLRYGVIEFVSSVTSPLIYPIISDKHFGGDTCSHRAAINHAEKLWALNKHELII